MACLLSLSNGVLVSTTGSFLKALTASSFRGVWNNIEKHINIPISITQMLETVYYKMYFPYQKKEK